MSRHRIFSEQALRAGHTVRLHGPAAAHISRVLRLRTGDEVVVFDGSGRDFEGRISALGRESVSIDVGPGREVATESPADITLLQGICRGARMDTVLQKSTELGVRRIVPIATERSVVRLDEERRERREDHWQRIVTSACEQCGRSRVPEVAMAQPLAQALDADLGHTRLLLDPQASDGLGTLELRGQSIALLVGPEGGLTSAEQRHALERGFRAVRLGPRVLRTETAPLAALALLQFLAGDLDG